MITTKIINYYIDRITIEDAIRYTKKIGYDFDETEMKQIQSFVKRNRQDISKENKGLLLNKIKKEVSITTFFKIESLVNKYVS